MTAKPAFTIVEIVMIIVVTGLIIAGVVVARNILDAAEMRNILSTLQEKNSSVTAFIGKYGEMPGDFRRGGNFGIGASGNGDDFLKDNDPNVLGWHDKMNGELANFWLHLSGSGLVEEEYRINPIPVAGEDFLYFDDLDTGVVAYTEGLTRFFHVGVASSDSDQSIAYEPGLMPYQMYYIDDKIDDANPLTGRVTSMMLQGGVLALDDGTAGNSLDTCTHPNGTDLYNIEARTKACQMRYMME